MREGDCKSIEAIKLSLSEGMGSLCFFKLMRYPLIASIAIRFASFKFLPWLTHPGSAGTITVNPPSGSGRNTIL